MKKSDRIVNGSWFGEDETVDADLLVNLLDTFRLGKANVLAGEIRSKESATALPDNTAAMKDEQDTNGSHGNKSVIESTSSASSSSDRLLESSVTEVDSNHEIDSNNETGSDLLETNSSYLPNVENGRQEREEDGEIEEEEEENSERSVSDSEEKSNLEKLLEIQDKYEFYCPKCSSCITRKVIIKKREKHIDFSADLEPIVPVDKPETQSEIEEMEPPVKVHIPETQENKGEGYIFTCFACLKYFPRLGTGFFKFNYIKGKPVEPESPPQIQPEGERFAVELLKSTVYGGLTETITSLGVVSSASASGSSTLNVLALAVANMAGGLIVLAQNLQDLSNNPDRYKELLGKRANFRIHILISVLSYIIFGLIPPLVYAFSFYQTGIKNYKLISVISISLVCVILLAMIKVYVRKPPKSYLKSAAYYTSIVLASSGISYIVGDFMGEYIEKLGWFSLDQIGMSSPFMKLNPKSTGLLLNVVKEGTM